MSHVNWLRGRTIVYNPPSKAPSPVSRFSVWIVLDIFRSALRKTCTVIGAFFLLLAVIGFVSFSKSHKEVVPSLPDEMILMLNLKGAYPESSATDPYLALLNLDNGQMSIDDVIDAMAKATHDKNVKALVVKSSGGSYDITQLQQMRAAVKAFRAAGKKTYIYGESYGEGGRGLGLYYLASAFDEIWLQPVGTVTIGGINLETPFFKDVMDKYGVQAQFFHRKEYKNAMEHLTANHMSDASREMTTGLVKELASQFVEPIKADRKIAARRFDEALDLGMLTDVKAKEFGLIDHLDYEDVLFSGLQKEFKNSGAVALEDYSMNIKKDNIESSLLSKDSTHPMVAVVHVDGMILSGSPDVSPYGLQDGVAGADDIADSIRGAAEDSRVKSIVLRVNSPGGSPAASETIHRAVEWARTVQKKPVVVSMGSVAASGGYWISAGASKIYAMDGTLTGSIGVVGGKLNFQDLWKKLDVQWGSVKYGKNAGLMSFNTPFTPSEQKQFEETLDSVYAMFINHVVKGRHMTIEKAESIAKGHVWTGRQALKLGLVDEIGGLDKVLDDEAKRLGVTSRDKLQVVHLPAAQGAMDMIMHMLSVQSSSSFSIRDIGALTELGAARPLVIDTTHFTLQH